MPDMTASEIITASYRKNGITSPTTQQLTDGLQDLQNMLSSWSAKGLVVPFYTTENFTLTIGQADYTIGATGDLTTVRPLRITDAFIRISNYDYPVDVNLTKSEFNRIAQKDTEGRPRCLYYDPQYPDGKIRFNYEADVAYDFHLVSEKPLVNPTATTTTFSISLEANLAMVYNLAILLSHDSDNQLSPDVIATAIESKETLESINAVDKLRDPVTLDSALVYTDGRHLINSITTGE